MLPDSRACKNLWRSAVEHHAFFRLTDRSQPPPKRRQLFRLRSRFFASFNTEYQMHNLNMFGSSSFRRRKNKSGSQPSTPVPNSPALSGGHPGVTPGVPQRPASFRRVPSKRFSSRSSFSSRSALDERRARRHRIPVTTEKTEADYMNEARAVVTAERACRRDPSWIPPSPHTPSTAVRTPTARYRPAPAPPSPATALQTAVRITPQLGRGQAPPQPTKPPRKINGALTKDSEKW